MGRIARHHVCPALNLFTFLMLWVGAMAAWQQVTPPPLPLMPFPSNPQLLFQRREQAMFFHFGINTFANQETGDGKDDPSIFNPQGLVSTFVSLIFGYLVIYLNCLLSCCGNSLVVSMSKCVRRIRCCI
jgi:hypothetical protein